MAVDRPRETEEHLHQRLMDGTADPGMYPDCAEHVGMIDHGDEQRAFEDAQLAEAEAAHERSIDAEAQAASEQAERAASDAVLEAETTWPEKHVALAEVPRRDLATIIANETPEEALEAFVAQLRLERIPPTTIRLREIQHDAGALADRLEARWGQETGGLGWKDGEDAWLFRGSSTRKWKDLPALLEGLIKKGMSLRTIAESISEMRVTDLREAAKIFTREKETDILELLEDHRGPHHGVPHFKKLED